MATDFLSQDEVDALLKGVTGESDEPESTDEGDGGVRVYNLGTQERIVRGRMPTMEVINERFARNIRIGLFNLIRKSPEVAIGGIKEHNITDVARHGARCCALVSELGGAPDIAAKVQAVRAARQRGM